MAVSSYLIAIIVLLIGTVVFIWWFNRRNLGEKIFVEYSEIIGGKLVCHAETYEAYINTKTDLLSIPKLTLERPVPPREAMHTTMGGLKKVYLTKFDNERWGYRLVNSKNEVMIYKRDEKGNMIYKDGEPIILFHKWAICDDIIEPDVKHWEDHMQEVNREKHIRRSEALSKWIAPLSLLLIFVFGIIVLQMTTKQLSEDKKMIMLAATQAEDDAKRTTDNMNRLIEKVTGQQVFTEDRSKYINSTKK